MFVFMGFNARNNHIQYDVINYGGGMMIDDDGDKTEEERIINNFNHILLNLSNDSH